MSLAGVVDLAHDTVQFSFRKNHDGLVLKCQVPRPGTNVTRTLEAIVTEKFKAVALENYLHVIRVPRIQDLQVLRKPFRGCCRSRSASRSGRP